MKEAIKYLIGAVIGIALSVLVVKLTLLSSSQVIQPNLGSGNQSLATSVQKADICHVVANGTQVLCSWTNTDQDGNARYITGAKLWTNAITATTNTFSFQFGTTTAAGATTSASVWGSTVISTTGTNYIVTSTGWAVANQVWANGQVLEATSTIPVTTTGWAEIDYSKQPTP